MIRKAPTRPAQPPPNPDGTQPTRLQQALIPPLNTAVTICLKYILIYCEEELDLKWSRNEIVYC